jgi:secreted protein with Ig-like and vWFA domain/tetratricopeptide (TPR) repeat protein
MNDHPPLEPVGDASLEARIVAWVLGEASAFEAGELERLCDERPELLVFRRRMRALQGLLSEAESAEADEAWKLAPDKRAKIEELFGESQPEQDIPILQPAAPSRSPLKPGRLRQRRRSEGPAAPSRWLVKTILTAAACVMFGMLYRFGFEERSSMRVAAKSMDFLPSEDRTKLVGGVGIIGGSSFEVDPQSPVTESHAWHGRSDDNGRIAGEKKSQPYFDADRQPASGADNSYKAKAAQAVAETESLADASKVKVFRELSYPNEYQPPELPNSVVPPNASLLADATNGGTDVDFDGFVNQGSPIIQAGKVDPFAPSQDKGTKLAARPPAIEAKPGVATGDLAFASGSESSFSRFATAEGAFAGQQLESRDKEPRQRRQEVWGESQVKDRVSRREIPVTPATPTDGFKNDLAAADSLAEPPIDGKDRFTTRGPAAESKPGEPTGLGVAAEESPSDLALGTSDGQAIQRTPTSQTLDGGTGLGFGFGGGSGGRAGNKAPNAAIDEVSSLGLETNAEETVASDVKQTTGSLVVSGKSELGDMEGAKSQVADGPLNGTGTIVTGGLRSGDAAINRNSIDAVLNNPNRSSGQFLEVPPADKPGEPSGELADFQSLKLAMPAAPPAPAAVAPQKSEAAKEKMLSESIVFSDPDSPKKTSEDAAIDGKNSPEEGIAHSHLGLAQREIFRRQEAVTEGDRLLMEGRDAYSKGDYQQASEKYKKALEAVPDAPMLADRRESYGDHLNDANVALAQQYRKVGKYDEAKALLGEVLKPGADPENAAAKREMEWLEDPIRTNSALTYEHTKDVDKVRKGLYTGEGNYNLGKFDDAKRDYEDVLRIDPSNASARRWLEKINSAKSDYYRAAYDHTRSELLMQVDKAWELSVPNDGKQPGPTAMFESPVRGNVEVLNKEQDEEKVKPAPTPAPIPTDEISASGEAFSTFSLHVSDASFKVAKAAMDRGERPDPESVRPEEFYNAFDYGDPTPAPGEPVACAIEQAAHPILPQRNLVRIAMRTGAAGRAASQPLNLTVLLDHSGSMEREDRHEGLNQAIVQLASLLKAGDTITVAGFSRTPRLMADRLPGERAKELIDIVRNTPSEGGTNLEEALKLGGDLALRQKNPAAQNRIVLLTDGAANLGNAKPEDLAERIRALRQQGISFDAAGLGAGGVNDRMLETLTRDGNGRYYLIDQPSDADANFAKQLAGAFRPAAENVKVQVHFNPARVGRYKLIGFEKHRLKTEDFRNDKVDAAELAAEEAGVALYQVETLPQGTGEIGEASVRFKDTSTGQMVEQTWTIPYDEKAAAFDQAMPSMQLASLAALTAEKLRGGPLAEATDFQSLTPQVAKVRAHYATSKKVGDLIEMIGKLK